jgi:hypothetical protein
MSTGPDPTGGAQPTEEELRAAYEAEIKKIRVEQVVLEQIVTLVNLGMRRTGMAPGTEDERDLAQVRLAIDAVRAQLPLLEQTGAPQVGQIRDAVSQLQLAYVRIGGQPGAGEEEGGRAGTPPESGQPAPGDPGGASGPGDAPPAGQPQPGQPQPGSSEEGQPGPAQRSGRLWIPGQ